MKLLSLLLAILCQVFAFGAEGPFGAKFVRAQGGQWHFPTERKVRAVVLIFAGHECPISNSYAPEVKRLVREFDAKGVKFCVVYAERDLSLAAAKKHAREFAYPCPAILDPQLQLVRAVKATITPEAAVLSPKREVLYLGRIDDRYAAYGEKRPQPKSRDLRSAIVDVLAGRPVTVKRSKAIGCYIDFGPKPDAGE